MTLGINIKNFGNQLNDFGINIKNFGNQLNNFGINIKSAGFVIRNAGSDLIYSTSVLKWRTSGGQYGSA